MNIEINTGYPTAIAWATSYQPAIQDMMMVIETFTKPPWTLPRGLASGIKFVLAFILE